MSQDLTSLLPTDKFEVEKAAALVALGFPAVEPVVPDLLLWLQDLNWPVAQVLAPFLACVGAPLASQVRNVLETRDEIWKYSVLYAVVRESSSLARELRPELLKLATSATPAEREEQIHVVASEILAGEGLQPEA